MLNLNVLQNGSTNLEKIRRQILTTRLYFIVYIIILFILVLYTSLNDKSITVNFSLSSFNHYQQLQMKYTNTLNCPCNRISIEYGTFIQLEPFYHAVCSSDFVTQPWFDYLYDDKRITDRDFHATASAQFQSLASFCRLTRNTIDTGLKEFYSTKLISDQLIPNQPFDSQTLVITGAFLKSISTTLKRTFDMINEIIHSNFYMSVYQTNWKFTTVARRNYSPIFSNPLTYNKSCSCGTSAKCCQSLIINGTVIDGLLIGCYPAQSMLQSSLQCFYNQSCLETILSYFRTPFKNLTVHSLTKAGSYEPDEKVESMVDRLFVDQWQKNTSYESYYDQCQPTLCTHSYIQNFDAFYTVATIVGLYGGLTTLLKLIVPLFMHVMIRLFRRRGTQVAQTPQT